MSRGDILARRKRRGFPSTAGNPACFRFGSRTCSPEVGGAGYTPRSGASYGPITEAPIRTRVIAARFLNAALSQTVVPRSTSTDAVHTFSEATHHPGFPHTANMDGMQPDPHGRQPPGDGGTRNTTLETACPKRSGSKPGTDDSCVTERTQCTPAMNGEILTLKKIEGLMDRGCSRVFSGRRC